MGKREGNQETPSPEEVRQMQEKVRELPVYVPDPPTAYDEYAKNVAQHPEPRGYEKG